MTAPELSDLQLERAETVAQIDALLAIRNAIDPQPISRTTLLARETDDLGRLRLLALVEGEYVGAGGIAWNATSRLVDEAYFRIWVLPDWRRRGIGSRLFEASAAFARSSGGLTKGFTRILADDTSSLEFAQHRGFQIFDSQQAGLLDLSGISTDDAVDMPDGIRVVSVAERPDLERELYELDALTTPEIPSMADVPTLSFEDWRRHLDEPVYQASLSLIALAGEDEVAGAIHVDDEGDGNAFISMLSVAPAMRRRGIARTLKRDLARRAAAGGWRQLDTLNDGTNDRIRRLNEELGYRYLPVFLLLNGPLPEAG